MLLQGALKKQEVRGRNMIYCFIIGAVVSARLMLLCQISRLGFIIGTILWPQLKLPQLAPIKVQRAAFCYFRTKIRRGLCKTLSTYKHSRHLKVFKMEINLLLASCN